MEKQRDQGGHGKNKEGKMERKGVKGLCACKQAAGQHPCPFVLCA